MVNSIDKGKSFERDIAKFLTAFTGSKWERTPMSGAFSTNTGSTDPRFSGDVFTEDPQFENYVIECKAYNDLQINELFNKKSKFYDWITQAETESKGKKWLLFIKINRKGVYVVLIAFCSFNRIQVCSVNIFNQSQFKQLLIGSRTN